MQRLFLVGLLLSACAGEVDEKTFIYDDRSGPIALDVYAPPGAADTPGVLVIHGGGWFAGSREEPAQMSHRLAEAGYVAISIDYRLVPDYVFPTQVQDSFCALAWARAHADEIGLDPDRLAVHGFSAGANLASMIGVAADVAVLQDEGCPSGRTGAPAAVISGDAGYDLTKEDNDIVRDYIGESIAINRGAYEMASPIRHVEGPEPPFLFFHATHDVPIGEGSALRMREALRAQGNRADIILVEGGGHAFNEGGGLGFEQYERTFEVPVVWAAMMDFLDHTIGGRRGEP